MARYYTPLARLTGAASTEVDPVCDLFWRRIQEFGAHSDNEVARLWARVRNVETRFEHEAEALWRRLEEFGATADAEVTSLWRRIGK